MSWRRRETSDSRAAHEAARLDRIYAAFLTRSRIGCTFCTRRTERELKIKLDAELHKSSDQDLSWSLPIAERVVLQQHRARVERVVHVDVRARAGAAELQQLREAEVHLMEALTVNLS